jgi:hypothetical protein
MTAAILNLHPAAPPGFARPRRDAADLVRLFALDILPAHRRTLACRWQRDADGRLSAIWEPDIVVARI